MTRFSLLVIPTIVALGLAIASPVAAQTGTLAPVVPSSSAQIQLSFAPVVRKVAPAVVNVFTKRVVQQRLASPLFNDPFFRQFFGNGGPFGAPQERVQSSLGSGVIVRPDGMIVTNFHVIKDSSEIRVVLNDRREFDATLVRSDERADLALLKIEGQGQSFPTLELRDSDEIEVGDLVLAIGNPFGVGQTVTNGIVSALARTNHGINDFDYFIQTDAAINPGNSGGALVTLDGRLVGINTAIYSQSGGSVGIGFAIPSNIVRTVIGTGGGKVVRSWLGASGQAVTADLAGSLGLDRPVGVLINDVAPDGPAARAGVKVGDVVTAVEGREVDDPESLRFRIATRPLGSAATLTLFRHGKPTTLAVALTAPPEEPPRQATLIRGNNPLSGAVVGNLSPALADELGIDHPTRGVVVLEVKPGSTAMGIQLHPGDIIARINEETIAAVDQLISVLNQRGGWRLSVRRGDETLSLTIRG